MGIDLNKRNGIFVITGIMASGKSTVSELLAKRFAKGVHVKGDVFRRMVVSGRCEMNPDELPEATEQLLLRYKLAAQTADEFYRAGFNVVVQDNYLGTMANDFLAMIATKDVFYITLCPSISAVLEREAKRNKKGYGEWTVEDLDRVLREENPRIGLWLDTSNLSLEETVDEILKRAEIEAKI